MKLTRIFAGISAAAVAAMAMAITSFAGTASYSATITLDSGSDDTKMAQISYADLGIPADAEAITNITFDLSWDCSTAYWAGGGGAVGIQANAEESGWVQVDMANVPEDYTVTTWTESIDFDPAGQDIAGAYAEGFVQIGWWWGADPSVEISNITVTYTGGTATDDTPADDTPADDTPADDTPADDTPADDTPADDTPADDTPADDDTATTTTTAAADDTATTTTTAAAGSAATGVEGVASVVALLTIAGAAVVVTKKN